MEKVVPQESSFNRAEKLDSCYTWLSYITASISFVAGILQEIQSTSELFRAIVETWLPGIVLVLTISTIIFHCMFIRQYQQAESIRRDTFFDNAFGCRLADKESKGYYGNDSIPDGLKKALLNVEESCFYSKDIIKSMVHRRLIIAIPAGLILIFVIILNLGGRHFTMLALNLFLSLSIVEDVVRLCRLRDSLEKVHSNCKAVISSCSTKNENNDQQRIAGAIIREIVRYESALAYASTMFDSKHFETIKAQKEKDWDKLKARYLQE